MSAYKAGITRAELIILRAPTETEYWLERARLARKRWETRLFRWRKRRFLNGFIAELESFLKSDDGQFKPISPEPPPSKEASTLSDPPLESVAPSTEVPDPPAPSVEHSSNNGREVNRPGPNVELIREDVANQSVEHALPTLAASVEAETVDALAPTSRDIACEPSSVGHEPLSIPPNFDLPTRPGESPAEREAEDALEPLESTAPAPASIFASGAEFVEQESAERSAPTLEESTPASAALSYALRGGPATPTPNLAGQGWASATEKLLSKRSPRAFTVELPSQLKDALSTSKKP